MELQQLRLMAGRVRGLLEQSNHTVSHNQALDLISALPGLRNWPEVQAFPDRVAACELDTTSAGRMAFRLKKKFELVFTPQSMLAELVPPGAERVQRVPQIWPGGPAPGVYITTSQDAINALLERYEEATDGALVYAERAGNHWGGSIDLGENGLWSNGLERVPSGTLLVVGPLELNQQSWGDSSNSLEMACLHAQTSGHRVAVLVRTQTPEAMCEDVHLMVRSIQPEGDDTDTALLGIVAADGDLQKRVPFSQPRPVPVQIRSVATVDAIPPSAREALKKAVSNRDTGLLLFGSELLDEHSAIDLVVSALNMTEHAGPAARIVPRARSTPAKDWLVPEAIKQLPFLPSVQSAYEQGYRRMVINPNYTSAEVLLEFGEDVLFIGGTYGGDVDSVFMNSFRAGTILKETDLLDLIIAILAVKPVPTNRGEAVPTDLFIKPESRPVSPLKFADISNYLNENLVLKWEDEMAQLLDSGQVTAAGLRKSMPRDRAIGEFLAQRDAKKRRVSAAH